MKIRLVCFVTLVAPCVSLSLFSGSALGQEFTRSTIPLKSGGSLTSIDSQGRNATYLSRDPRTQAGGFTRTADARNSVGQSGVDQGQSQRQRETGFAQAGSGSANSSSFYRAQQSAGSGEPAYPYPTLGGSSGGSQLGGGNGSFSNASAANDSQATLRFDRSGLGERPSGALGANDSAANSNRVAQLPQPPLTLPNPATALPNPAAALPNLAAAALPATPTFGNAGQFNFGPNYVNPAANFAGYQGFQPQPQAANTVPALNVQNPTTANACRANCCCCVPQQQQQQQFVPQTNTGFQGFQGYQFQPNIGQAQFGANNNPWWSSFLSGSGQYSPLLQFRNMPPGTYLGQGLIGQPTAYVDGQPIRNLFRYVAP